ncbi:MAG TPA: signal peptidase II [Oscillospiraceae bacterium]|nr:signal peptidase II [Oscillospiraceae bacterium]
MKQNKKLVWVLVFVLTALEQGIKIIINRYYLQVKVPLVPPWIYFAPLFNRDYSWINSLLQLGVGKVVHIMIVVAAIILIYFFYRYVADRYKVTALVGISFALFFAGALCSLLDKVFWDGSLDYLLVTGFFTFDLKDAYLNVAVALIVLMLAIDHQGMRTAEF